LRNEARLDEIVHAILVDCSKRSGYHPKKSNPDANLIRRNAFMSKDAIAGVYTQMLTDPSFLKSVADDPEILNSWDLTREEKTVLIKEARVKKVAGSRIESGPVMSHLVSKRGPQLSAPVASGLGVALNQAAGLPLGALNGPGFLSNAACCPWGKPVIGKIRKELVGLR
jgi:hypothetical protein